MQKKYNPLDSQSIKFDFCIVSYNYKYLKVVYTTDTCLLSRINGRRSFLVTARSAERTRGPPMTSTSSQPVCECSPDKDGNPTVHQDLSCQGKGSLGKMNHVDFLKVCQCKHDYITISTDEKERLEKVWKKNGQNWEWIWNDSEECYYPQFFEPTDNDE